ncbi:cyclodeaminase/cyclohydrolase family protein [Miltoncostaea oceani]|uniref:cyclodeaminase/cyclohydrolase family protein n=1 Tax=Miltoncostaea oceani TaxID=2843216 RepID=UPI001C3D6D37|nr:cyclodeaminase/cyclohydrolase family protein [Miltoncostaea oceani]
MAPTVSAHVIGLLADLSDPGSGVGTGSAAAAVGAIAASALQGVARGSLDEWSEAGGSAAQAEALAARLASLAVENDEAYRQARAALEGELPTGDQGRRDFTLAQVLDTSARVPGRIAAAAADVAELAESLAGHALDRLRPDARASGVLAAAAADVAAQLVEVNLGERADGALRSAARASVARARQACVRTGGCT